MKKILTFLIPTLLVSGLASAEVSAETAFVFNTFLFVFCGILVMFMALGFAMLEAGFVRKKNTSAILLKNIALYSIAGIMFYLIGYSLMYVDVSGWIGSLGGAFYNPSSDELALLDGAENVAAIADTGYSVASDWFFQMVFCATAISIVSGACAERIKVWPFMIFAAIMTGIIYPIYGSWTWGGGWLAEMGFSDFAGSTIVHSVGGWAAVVGCLILGPRAGKYSSDGKISPIAGANMPLACLGTFILWFGWFGFNGGSALAANGDAAMAMLVTHISAATAAITWMFYEWVKFGKPTALGMVTGIIAGLGTITPASGFVGPAGALVIGFLAGVVCFNAVIFVKQKLKIDDSLDVFPVHGVGGIIGTLLAGIFAASSLGIFSGQGLAEGMTISSQLGVQFVGVISTIIYTAVATFIILKIIEPITGLRVSDDEEQQGIDITSHEEKGYDL